MGAWLSVDQELEGVNREEVQEAAEKEKDPSRNEIPEADLDAKGSTFLPEENILNTALGVVVP